LLNEVIDVNILLENRGAQKNKTKQIVNFVCLYDAVQLYKKTD